MKNLVLNHKIHSFMKMKENEMPELKRNNIDKMIEELTIDTRDHLAY